MPQFFAQSKIFKASTYRHLRARLFGERARTGSSGAAVLSKNANGSNFIARGNDKPPRLDYLELSELPRAHVVEGSLIFGVDNDSSVGIAKTTNFDMVSGPNSERDGEP